jgi:GTP 3',8-cyclase
VSEQVTDTIGRPMRSLRLSVTDRCNLRCSYCMPEANYAWLPHDDLLHFEETCALLDIFISLGVDKVRLTGGEPLLRRELPRLVSMLSARPGLSELALTTNGILLAAQVDALKAAGLHRITVSLDTLRPDRFLSLTRRENHSTVLAGIAAAQQAFGRLKIDTVIIAGFNDDEMPDLIEYGREHNAEVRFIEYMDVAGATKWSPDQVMSRRQILERLEAKYGRIEAIAEESAAPASRFVLPDGTVFGIIASTTEPFCRTCDRSRLTADGVWYLCLYAANGIDLRTPLRRRASVEEIRTLLTAGWTARDDRGAEQRLALGNRRVIPVNNVGGDPHLEMHTRGG